MTIDITPYEDPEAEGPARSSTPHPCPPPEPKWWAARSDEYLDVGPFDTKEDAIDEAIGQGSYEELDRDEPGFRVAIHVGLYLRKHLDLSQQFCVERFLASVEDGFDEGETDEDGDNGPFEGLSREDTDALETAVREAIWKWQHERKLPLRFWALDFLEGETVTREIGG